MLIFIYLYVFVSKCIRLNLKRILFYLFILIWCVSPPAQFYSYLLLKSGTFWLMPLTFISFYLFISHLLSGEFYSVILFIYFLFYLFVLFIYLIFLFELWFALVVVFWFLWTLLFKKKTFCSFVRFALSSMLLGEVY